MANQYTPEPPERAIAVKLLSRGEVTVAEIANHFGLGRQTVQHWARRLDVKALRAEAIARAVSRATRP